MEFRFIRKSAHSKRFPITESTVSAVNVKNAEIVFANETNYELIGGGVINGAYIVTYKSPDIKEDIWYQIIAT